MKATFFASSLEFSVVLNGEKWRQGDVITGHFSIKNHKQESVTLTNGGVQLAYGSFKEVRAKKENPFQAFLNHYLIEQESLPAGQQIKRDWQIEIKEDWPFTDEKASFYLLYGLLDLPQNFGQVQLIVDPKSIIDSYLSIFCSFFSFLLKSKRFNKGYVEAKLIPPPSEDLKMVEELNCEIRVQNGILEIKNNFTLKNLAKVNESLAIKKNKLESSFSLTPREYILRKEAPHQENIVQFIQKMLEPVKSKVSYK